MSNSDWVIVVHGGAGAMRSMGAHKEAEYRQGLERAAQIGEAILEAGGSAVDATVAAVAHMETCGAFNAGQGSCLTLDGRIEADAAVMSGGDLSYGSVAAVPNLGNAVIMAEAIRTGSAHCLFAGPAALDLASSLPGYEVLLVEPSPSRLKAWKTQMAESSKPIRAEDLTRLGGTHDEGDTVGAVALDTRGGLAAAVSTGGIWLKSPGRVGDSPIAGAGLWAEDGVVACAATGTGEFIMRTALAADVRARCLGGASASEAGEGALGFLKERFGPGRAGLIALDANGEISTAFDTAGMGRAWIRAGDPGVTVRVWPEENPASDAETGSHAADL